MSHIYDRLYRPKHIPAVPEPMPGGPWEEPEDDLDFLDENDDLDFEGHDDPFINEFLEEVWNGYRD